MQKKVPLQKGARQGDTMSPKLFIKFFIMLKWSNTGIKVGSKYLSSLQFADDIVLSSETSGELNKMIKRIHRGSLHCNHIQPYRVSALQTS